ncbi:MAG TPA: 2-hydroxychromene-2-carboxylate isomerase, partial [Gammaproteobacteria bacterium]|nr:2-hydroxychromene-2-carboxylate isomerase [Gammaproteobacteria bacterium]
MPRPIGESATGLNASGITLEYFPSLRSPYTAVGHQRVMDLVKRSGVTLKLRPVMPMMMRGVPAPRQKQLYIISDSKRESVAAGVRFQNFVDPLGEPVKRAFSLYPWVTRQGKAEVFVAAYLRAAWADGVDICSDSGLRLVIES